MKNLLKKFNGLKLKKRVREAINGRKIRRKVAISHGVCTMRNDEGSDGGTLIAYGEQIGTSEAWLFGVFDHLMGDVLTTYLQLYLFDVNVVEDEYGYMAKRVMKRAYELAKTCGNDMGARDEEQIRGSAAVFIIGGERFISADYGGYRAVVSKGGVAIQIGVQGRRLKKLKKAKLLLKPLKEKLQRNVGQRFKSYDMNKRIDRPAIATKCMEPDTEFMILASDGLWEVMQNQEAIDLIWHIEDSQEAARCLAQEAINRMSKSTISCIVVRFR